MTQPRTNFLRAFFATESAGGIVLAIAALIALIAANSPWSSSYLDFWHPHHLLINEGLMSVFFFLVGLELKQEFLHGQLSNPKMAALPVIAALGGMVLPALLFTAFNLGGSGANGWAVPMPTDIALALGALALVGSRIPGNVKTFLLTLAIADDLGSILVLAIFYRDSLSIIKIAATIGAVVLAFILPNPKMFPLNRLIHTIHPWTSFLILPLFALANIGITIDLLHLGESITQPVTAGVIVGRVVGKLCGISLFAWVAVRIGIAKKPDNLSFTAIAGAGALAGMGLTVSLVMADLALPASLIGEVKIGLIVSALISATIGLLILKRSLKPQP